MLNLYILKMTRLHHSELERDEGEMKAAALPGGHCPNPGTCSRVGVGSCVKCRFLWSIVLKAQLTEHAGAL